MIADAEGFLKFAAQSPTAFHAVAVIGKMLETAGYTYLAETEKWNLRPGDKRYVTRNGSALIAFCVPEHLGSFRIAAAHSDSPTL